MILIKLRLFIFLVVVEGGNCLKLLSRNKTVTASSQVGGWRASLTVDGNYENDDITCDCCAATYHETDPWFQLDLGATEIIERIEVKGIDESYDQSLRNMEVYLTPRNTTSTPILMLNNTDVHILNYTLPEPQSSRYVTFISRNDGFLFVICELSVYGPCEKGWYGENCVNRCGYCKDGDQCNDGNGTCPNGCDPGYTGSQCKQRLKLLSRNKTVTASSQHEDWKASRTVDGNYENDANACQCCAATKLTKDPWIQLDLGATKIIERIEVKGSKDNHNYLSLRNMEVYLTHRNKTSSPILTLNNTDVRILKYTLPEPQSARYVTFISRNDGFYFVICELSVYGPCEKGWYGENCVNRCGHCKDADQCYDGNGTCPNGCDPGYTGSQCKQQCYGRNCTEQCGRCKNGVPCNVTNGVCPDGCASGYTGDRCKTECKAGRYGDNCKYTCGTCRDNQPCNISSGICTNGCGLGYTTDYCNEACDDSHYGYMCGSKCGQCHDDKPCNKTNGHCVGGCQAGFQLPICSSECNPGTYGKDCKSPCGHCFNDTACDVVNGTCMMCDPGFKGVTCKACEHGRYGDNCVNRCGQCKDGDQCYDGNGTCPNGCDPGYLGSQCKQPCPSGTFGSNCQNDCGMCQCGDVCDRRTGVCPNGCSDGYQGDQCLQMAAQKHDPHNTISIPILVGVILGSILVILVAVLTIVVFKQRRTIQESNRREVANTTPANQQPNASHAPSNYEALQLDNVAAESTYSELI